MQIMSCQSQPKTQLNTAYPAKSLLQRNGDLAKRGISFGNNLGPSTPKLPGWLKFIDFAEIGWSNISQIQIVYAACILWRLVAANERRKASPTKSWNEIRESLLRDSVGYAFWFFGVPTLQRLYLGLIPEPYRKVLRQPTHIKDQNSVWGLIKKWNPITGYAIPTSEQVKDMKRQALVDLEKMGVKSSEHHRQQIENFYEKLIMHRNLATGIGLLSTVLLLGVGINALNMYLTRKNIAKKDPSTLNNAFPAAPPLPNLKPPANSISAPAIPLTASSNRPVVNYFYGASAPNAWPPPTPTPFSWATLQQPAAH